MADITKTNAVKNGNVLFSPAAGASSQTIPVSKDERMCIYVNNGSASPITATIPKGNGIASAAGDLAVTVTNATSQIIGPLESARFIDTTTGKITLNLSATASVTVAVIQL
jgi:uncharacterized protein involved in propanediol utilization